MVQKRCDKREQDWHTSIIDKSHGTILKILNFISGFGGKNVKLVGNNYYR